MESDSDNFESADEEFLSDDEVKQIEKININKSDNSTVTPTILNVKTSKEETTAVIEEEKHDNDILENKDNTTSVSNNESNNANVVETKEKQQKPRVIEKRERPQKVREPKSKLGVKLGTKLNTENKNEAFWQAFTEAKKNEYATPPLREECWEIDPKSIKTAQNTETVNISTSTNVSKLENTNKETDASSNLYSKTCSNFNPDKNFWENEENYMELPRDDASQSKTEIKDDSGWGSWGNWGGMSSLISTAQLSVSTISNITNTVSQGVTKVLETGIGIPDPEQLAKLDREKESTEKEKTPTPEEVETPETNTQQSEPQQQQQQRGGGGGGGMAFGLGNFVSGVTHITKLVESTGTKVLTGGLDTLEVIGKKTMEVLQDGDPGLKKKRALFKIDQDKPVLSQILREAKEKAEEEDKINEGRHIARKPHYETMFDDFQGLVHLEALEMLSKQCDIKLETLLDSLKGPELQDMQETMAQIKELCELPDEEEDTSLTEIENVKEKVENAVSEMNISISYNHFLETWSDIDNWMQGNVENSDEIHEKAIESLAQLTAIAVEQFHKAGELLLVKERRSTVDESDSLVQLTITLTGVIGLVAGKFSEKLNTAANSSNSENVNSLITNIFLEAANSSSYIQDAFNLMIPVLQVGAI